MKHKEDMVILEVRSPKAFLIFFAVALSITVFVLVSIFVMGVHDLIRDRLTISEMLKVFVFLAIIFGLVWYTRYFYCTVFATDSGLRAVGPFGLEDSIEWGEITCVRAPYCRVPRNFTYIFSKAGKKIVIINGMTGYSELLTLIETRAVNLPGPRKLHDLWPEHYSVARDWKTLLILVGLVALYALASIVFRF